MKILFQNLKITNYCTSIENFWLATCSITTIQDTKQRISELLAVEEENSKTQQHLLSSSSKEETDNSVDTTPGTPDVRVTMMGTEGSGKACLEGTLTGQELKDTPPTEGADEMKVIVKNPVDWSVLTKDEMIENPQQQVSQETKHCATERSQLAPEDTTASTSKSQSAL